MPHAVSLTSLGFSFFWWGGLSAHPGGAPALPDPPCFFRGGLPSPRTPPVVSRGGSRPPDNSRQTPAKGGQISGFVISGPHGKWPGKFDGSAETSGRGGVPVRSNLGVQTCRGKSFTVARSAPKTALSAPHPLNST
jgi:hypothetical protein